MSGAMNYHWGEKRLQCLFERYNRKHWRGRLPQYRVVPTALDCLGQCRHQKRIIEIDPNRHESDRRVRATLLHEMAHAAAPGRGHGLKFFAEMERLLRRGALVTIETEDLGGVRILDDIVPRRFTLLRKKVQRLEARRANAISDLAARKKLPTETITDEHIINA
jgi:SprT-like family